MVRRIAAISAVTASVWISAVGWTPGCASAQESGVAYAGSREAAFHLLNLVPHPRGHDPRPIPSISYVDLEAIVNLAYADATHEASISTLDRDELLTALERVSIGPQNYVELIPDFADQIPETLGVHIGDIHRVLEFGSETTTPWGIMLDLAPGNDHAPTIAAALDARHFKQRDINGVTVWYRRDFGEITTRPRDPGDPFRNGMGREGRVAYLDGVLVSSPYWSVTEGMVAATDDGRSVMREAAVRAAVAAVTDPTLEGVLLQLHLLDRWDALPASDRLAEMENDVWTGAETADHPAEAPPMFWHVAIADRSTGDHDEVLIALAYRGRQPAEVAAAALAERFLVFAPPEMPNVWTDLLTELNATVSPDVFHYRDGGRGSNYSIALVRISYPSPTATNTAEHTNRIRDGAVFSFLISELERNALTPLVLDPRWQTRYHDN